MRAYKIQVYIHKRIRAENSCRKVCSSVVPGEGRKFEDAEIINLIRSNDKIDKITNFSLAFLLLSSCFPLLSFSFDLFSTRRQSS